MKTRAILCTIAVLTLAALSARAQMVTTLTEAIPGGSGGVAVDMVGNIYVADWGATLDGPPGTRVFKVTPEGAVSVFVSGLSGASGNAFDSEGNLFQSNFAGHTISKIDPSGNVTTFSTSGLVGPVGIAIDSEDNLFVCNCSNNTIRKITKAGVSTQFASSSLFNCPNGITFDDANNLYVSNFGGGSILKIDPAGVVTFFVTVPGGNNGHLTFYQGDLYVAGRGANRIYKVTLSRQVSVFAGSGIQGVTDGPLLQARFSLPNDLAFDPTGRYLYVNDVLTPVNNRDTSPMVVRKIELGNATDVGVSEEGPPSPFVIHPNYPNPFAETTRIPVSLQRASYVVAKIYNVVGAEITTLREGMLAPGNHVLEWKAQNTPSGAYFLRIRIDDQSASQKLIVLNH